MQRRDPQHLSLLRASQRRASGRSDKTHRGAGTGYLARLAITISAAAIWMHAAIPNRRAEDGGGHGKSELCDQHGPQRREDQAADARSVERETERLWPVFLEPRRHHGVDRRPAGRGPSRPTQQGRRKKLPGLPDIRPSQHTQYRESHSRLRHPRDAKSSMRFGQASDQHRAEQEMRRNGTRDRRYRPAVIGMQRLQEDGWAVKSDAPGKHGDEERCPYDLPSGEPWDLDLHFSSATCLSAPSRLTLEATNRLAGIGLGPREQGMLNVVECARARASRNPAYDGRFFTGVRTTGVYCRPVCPVRPARARNVEFFFSAAAAEAAGYRPCLRCRPETAHFSPAWKGSRTTVERAMRLINAGALDDRGVEDLAARLGVGPRHLSRLFEKHVGANPTQVAKTARIQRAKRLIDSTDLPMTEIALRSGFRSLRRFNGVFAEVYKRPPSEIRRARHIRPH